MPAAPPCGSPSSRSCSRSRSPSWAGWSRTSTSVAAALAAAGIVALRYPGMDQDEAGVWTAPGGSHVMWFLDPDGNVLSLTAA